MSGWVGGGRGGGSRGLVLKIQCPNLFPTMGADPVSCVLSTLEQRERARERERRERQRERRVRESRRREREGGGGGKRERERERERE